MRSTIAACAILVLLIGTANAEQCPPGALGVSRTLVVDPNEHPRIGSMQYPETLPLDDHEVVLTFDDGPLPRYTSRVLETLASECVKATFFMVGQMARAYPSMVRRVYDEGHTVANHTQNHPIRKMSATQAAREIRDLSPAMGCPSPARTAYESVNGAHARSLRQSVRLRPPRRCCAAYVRFCGKADMGSRSDLVASDANDPEQTSNDVRSPGCLRRLYNDTTGKARSNPGEIPNRRTGNGKCHRKIA